MPSLDEFFAEAIEQADPANMVEDEYKYVRAVEPVIAFKTLTHNLHSTLHGINPNCTFIVCFSFSPPFSPRVVRNSNYGWRALRLLSRRSPHFFQPTNQKFKSLADYLDSMVSKLAKELPVSGGGGLLVSFRLTRIVVSLKSTFWITVPIAW